MSYPTLVPFLNKSFPLKEPNIWGALGWDRKLTSLLEQAYVKLLVVVLFDVYADLA